MNGNYRKWGAIVLWLLIWHLGALAAANSLLLPRVDEVFRALLFILGDRQNRVRIANTVFHIFCGFGLAFILGIGFGFLSYFHVWLKDVLNIPVSFLKSVPIVSLVILLLLYFGSEILPLFIVLSMVFPQIYTATLEGLLKTDKNRLEMARIYGMKRKDVLRHIYFHDLLNYLRINTKISIGFAWKAGVAAEVIALSKISMGEALYFSKIYLNTADLFAWTVLILCLSKGFEKVSMCLLGGFRHGNTSSL